MPDVVFTLRVMAFTPYDVRDCPYHILPPEGAKETLNVHTNGNIYPTWDCGKGIDLHVGHYQKPFTFEPKKRIPTTIRLTSNHAVLGFKMVDDKDQPGRYYPMGIGFFRADESAPMGSPFTTGARRVPIMIDGEMKESPFSKMKFNDPPGTIEFDVERIAKLSSKGI